MDLKDLFTQDLDKAKDAATQAGGNALFNFLGLSLQKEATEAGLEITNQFVPKVDKNPSLSNSAQQMVDSLGASSSILIMGAVLVGAFLFLGKKKAA